MTISFNTIEGNLLGEGLKIGIVVGRFNDFTTRRLLDGALDELTRHGVKESDITVARVPGSFEIPAVTRKMVLAGKYDGVIALGAVIRGGTPHFEYIAAEATKGVAQVAMSSDIPVVFGVLTCNTVEEAIERAGAKSGNKGSDAARSVLEMANLYRSLE